MSWFRERSKRMLRRERVRLVVRNELLSNGHVPGKPGVYAGQHLGMILEARERIAEIDHILSEEYKNES